MVDKEELVVYADGSALGNPGPAGWAFWVNKDYWAAGGFTHSTNNVGELTAIAEILEQLPTSTPLEIRCDSKYAISCSTEWLAGWKRRGWVKADGKPVANREILERIDAGLKARTAKARFTWVKGHSGEPGNEAVDEKARAAATRARSGSLATQKGLALKTS